MTWWGRRGGPGWQRVLPLLVVVALAVAGVTAWLTVGRSGTSYAVVTPTDAEVAAAEQARSVPQAKVKAVTLTAAPADVRIGDQVVRTWAFDGQVPGPEIRLAAGDVLEATVVNRLPQPLTMHWHGIALRNDMDGVPGVTQPAVEPGGSFTYRFTVPDEGTFWYHPHTQVQVDRGLYGPLVVTSRAGTGVRDIPVMLDDWTDGMGEDPDQVLARLRQGSGTGGMDHGSTHGMNHGSMPMGGARSMPMTGADTGDVTYPAYLVNGGTAAAPKAYDVTPGETVRLRLVDAGADTTFQVAVGGARMRVVAADGYDVRPVTVDTLTLAMGERYDVEVTAPRSGTLPIVAVASGKDGRTAAVLRVGSARAAVPSADPEELSGTALRLSDLHAADALPPKAPDRTYAVDLTGGMGAYDWALRAPRSGGVTMPVRQGERVQLVLRNRTMMSHPMHLHGHTFEVVTGAAPGPRKDTVLVPAMGSVTVVLDADNPGRWMLHCHNAYHGAVGMMTELTYVR